MRPTCRALLPLAIPLTGLLRAQDHAALDQQLAGIAAAYAAKITASAVFVSGRTVESVLAEELAPDHPLEAMIRPFLRLAVDRDAGTVTCRLGQATATAVATRGLGCTLLVGDATIAQLQQRCPAPVGDTAGQVATEDPLGFAAMADDGIDHAALAAAVDAAFHEPATGNKVRTRAVLVVCRGRVIAERYADGYDATMRLPGWSMTKTFVNALVGVRVQQGKLDLQAPLATPDWPADDARQQLRLPDLLAMASGLSWSEDYERPDSDVLAMLFQSADHAAVQAAKPLTTAPGATFVYASGTTNLICRELRHTFADDEHYWAFPRRALFAPLHMASALIETDPSGTFVGSSYGFATARDWARFGLLLIGDGVVDGTRLLPAGWNRDSARPMPASNGRFGRHLWLNADPDGDGPRERMWPALPADLVHMDGHQGQYVCVMPTQQIVVVRLGCTKAGGFGLRPLLEAVLAACGR